MIQSQLDRLVKVEMGLVRLLTSLKTLSM